MHPLAQRIADLTNDARRVALGAALGWLSAAVVGVALVLMSADYVMRLSDPGMRWLSAAVLLTAAAAAVYRWVAPRDWRHITPLSLAQRVQSTWPSLGSRLASAVEFLNQPDHEPTAGSNDLRRSVVIQVASEVDELDLSRVIDRGRMRRALQALAACIAGLVVFGLLDPGGLQTAAARLLAPWQDNQWPRKNYLVVANAPDRVARGQSFQASIRDLQEKPLPSNLRVQYRLRVGGESRIEEQALPTAGREARVLRENVQQGFAFRVLGGDDIGMRWHDVEVVDPPRIKELTLTGLPPEYTGLPRTRLQDRDRVLAGSRLEVNAETGEPASSAAWVTQLEGEEPSELRLDVLPTAETGKQSLRLSEPFIAELEGNEAVTAVYRLRMESEAGLVGYTSPLKLRIEPDKPPKLEWITPTRELLVTNQALVPVQVLVEDNLATARATLLWRHDVLSAEETPEEDQGAVNRAEIYRGPVQPPRRSSVVWGTPADSRVVGYEFDLAALDLSPGDQLQILVEASDYRPGVGTTPLPQRITILTEEEFDSLMAERQAELVKDLERLLAEQRETRQVTGELEIERHSGAAVEQSTLDRLSTLGFDQLRINEGVSDPASGAARQAEDLLEQLSMNRQQRPELAEQLQSIREQLKQLADGPLALAGRGLADARRAGQQAIDEGDKQAADQLDESVADAGKQQDRAIASLEKIVEQMSDWSSYQRFAQELADLEHRQNKLRVETVREATRAATAKPGDARRGAARQKLSAAQRELSRRFGKLLDSMRKAAGQAVGDSAPSVQSLKDALSESRDRDTAGKLREAERQLAGGQLGLSAREQQQAAEDLKEMLDILRDRASADPSKLTQQLLQAQQKLRELQKELNDLRKQANQPGQERKREGLADKTERMSRRLNRLDAPQAGQSAQQGAGQMQQSANEGQQGRRSLDNARQSLKDAQEKLAERIKQLKDILALRVLDRLAARTEGFILRQTKVIEETVGVSQEQESGVSKQKLVRPIKLLNDAQTELRQDVDVARRNVAEREVFELALRGVLDQMDQAIERLARQQVGRPTQRREYGALERLKHVADALKINPPDPSEEEQQQGGGGQAGGQPKPPSPIDVAELKLLRVLQLDLNARTRDFEAESADENLTPQQAAEASLRLSNEQKRLGDLVRELIERNNKPPQQSGELPNDAV